MDKDSPLDDLTEESDDDIGKQKGKTEIEGRKQDTQSTINRIHGESRTLATEKDSGREYEEDKLKRTREKFDSEEGKFGSSLDGEVSRSEDSSKTEQDTQSTINRIDGESRTLATEKDSVREYEEDKLKGTREKIDSEEEKLGSSLDGVVSKSEDSSKTEMLPTISSSRIKTLKDEEKFEIQDKLKQLKSTDNLKQKFLALEKEVRKDDIETQNIHGGKRKKQDVIKGIHEESRMPSTEEDSIRKSKENELIGTTSKFESKVGRLGGSLVEEGSKSEEPSKMHPSKTLSRVEVLKEEAKSQIQNEQTQRNDSTDLKEKLLALERELSVESIQSKTIGIFLPSELKKRASVGTEKEIPELNVKPQRKGISPRMTILFIISAATGSAFQYLPFHLKESTWFGVFFVLLFGFNSLYACLCTGWCWKLMEEIWPEYAAWSRVPYQDMAYRAAGPWMKYIVMFLIHVTAFVLCCNYILALSESLGLLLYPHFTLCHFIIVASVVLTFLAMLGSYRNMKLISVIDVVLSFLFMFFLIVCFFYDESKHGSRHYDRRPTENVIMAFAGISYAFGMGMVVPNIVVEMDDRSKFTESCVTAFMVIMAMYTVLAILGYAAYGSKTKKHITYYILQSETLRNFGIFIDVLQALQLATTFTMYFVPLVLSLEEIFKCPERFCSRRVIIRLGTMIAVMILILGIPRILIHLDVIVATFLNILSFLFPPIFHVLLLKKLKASASKRILSVKEIVLVGEILLLGSIIALVAIYVSVKIAIHYPPNLLSCFLNMSLYNLN